jgi:hypothetical protein
MVDRAIRSDDLRRPNTALTRRPETAAMSAASAVRDSPVQITARRLPGNADGELEALAVALTALSAQHAPGLWRTPGFARRVEAARRQLLAARSRDVLAGSYEREACRLGPATPGSARHAEAVRAAYAMRWLELARGAELPSWTAWLDGPAASAPFAR